VVLGQLPAGSPVLGYLRRLLLSGDAAGTALFSRWHALTAQVLDQMTAAGIVRPSADPATRTAFLLVNDLAALLMHEHLAATLGVDPLTEAGMSRWTDVVLDVYHHGLFTGSTSDPASTRAVEEQ
jgi:TetR/AcrR family transcriptional regulator, regulator of cefoperazone and chloramphenicol sensitivity